MAILVPKKIRHMYPVGDCFWLMRVMKFLWVSIIRKFRTEQHRDSILNVRKQALDGAVKFNNDLEKAFLAFDALKKVTKKTRNCHHASLSTCRALPMEYGRPQNSLAKKQQTNTDVIFLTVRIHSQPVRLPFGTKHVDRVSSNRPDCQRHTNTN